MVRCNFRLSSLLPNPGQVCNFKVARKLNCVWLLAVTSAERTPLLLLGFRVRALLSRERNSDRRVTEALCPEKIISYFS